MGLGTAITHTTSRLADATTSAAGGTALLLTQLSPHPDTQTLDSAATPASSTNPATRTQPPQARVPKTKRPRVTPAPAKDT